MEGKRGGLGAAIVNHGRGGIYSGDGSNRDHGAMVGTDHRRQKLADETEVGEDIDGKGTFDGGFGGFENRRATASAGVVDQDRGMAKGRADGGCDVGDSFGGGYVAGKVVDVGA